MAPHRASAAFNGMEVGDMDYVKPADVASAMVNAGRTKLALSPLDLVIRGGLAGAILAAATSLAITGAVFTGLALYITHKPRTSAPAPLVVPTQVPAE